VQGLFRTSRMHGGARHRARVATGAEKKKEPTDPVRDVLKPKPARWPKPKPSI